MTSTLDQMLEGVRVLDLSRVMSGPFCTAMFADLGAEVIKIEMPGVGDDSRHFGPFVEGESAYFMLLNRGKKSVTLDLKSDRGRDLLKALVAECDVVVENFRPGVAKRLGLHYDTLTEINPTVIYASISGFGQDGPFSDRPAYDLIVQAMSGVMDITGQRDGPPTAVGESVVDVCTGMFAAWGISTALFNRERTGKGRHLDIAMLDSMYSMMLTVLGMQLFTDRSPSRVGSRHPMTYPVDVFPTMDGYIVMVITTDRAFGALCNVIGRLDMASDEKFLTNSDRNAHEAELKTAIEAWTSTLSREDAVAALTEAGLPAGPVLSVGDVAESEHISHRGMMTPAPHPVFGNAPTVRQPVTFSGAQQTSGASSPMLGEHTRQILVSVLGMDDSDFHKLERDGVV